MYILFSRSVSAPIIYACVLYTAEAAVLYVAMIYTFFCKKELKQGNKQHLRSWAELHGTRLRWLASYYIKLLGNSPTGRHEKIQVLKMLYYRVNGLTVPQRSSSRSSIADSEASEGKMYSRST